MQFTLTINMDNEAFQNRPLGELAECLNSVVERLCLSGNQPVDNGRIRDTNGNTVGNWSIEKT